VVAVSGFVAGGFGLICPMTTLTQALERIMNWLKQHRPEYAASFLPGLKYEEIQAGEAELGFKLPEEIYELYQWRNGTEREDIKVVCFPTMQFLPLSTAIEYSQEWNEYISEEKFTMEEIEEYETGPLFRFLQANCDSCGIPLINYQTEKPPVVVLGEGEMPSIWYASLTDMMLMLAELYETGAYYLDEEGFTTEDESKSAVVLHKYQL
jgi:hypothetical protein